MKILSLFSGIGAFEKSLDNLGIDYELVGFSEIDKYAVKSYCAVHGVDESLNIGDITKVDETKLPKDIDLITYGFPCQDISLAGKQKGLFNEDGTQTRSGLFFDALRIIEETQPKVAIAENVKNLTGKKFKLQFEIVLKCLENAGYNNYWKVLNAKDFGIPQNRERVFIVSIRKDIDTGEFKFPEGFPLTMRLKDVLENEVDEKFYISNSQLENLVRNGNNNCNPSGKGMNGKVHTGDVAPTLTTNKGEGPKITELSFVNGDICKTVRASGNGSLDRHSWDMVQVGEPFVTVKEATKKGYAEAVEGDSINYRYPNSKTRRGRVGKQIAGTLTTEPQQGVVVKE
jgi:DNA (cytosine-5)-methyltransferase 1